jgi:hypothetical protein
VHIENRRGRDHARRRYNRVGSDYYTARFDTIRAGQLRVDAELKANYLELYGSRFVRPR